MNEQNHEQMAGGMPPGEPAADPDAGSGDPAAEVAELKDRLLRALAEQENLRRRGQREVEEARRYAVTGFARGLLDVSDNLTRALQAVPIEQRAESGLLGSLVQGVEMTERALQALLEKHEIKKVQPNRGERFDPAQHQAMFELPTAELPPGAVAEVMQPGYVIADRLLRPAMVGVAKAAPGGGYATAAGSTATDDRSTEIDTLA